MNTSDIATDFGRVFTAVTGGVATELDRRIAVALSMTAGSIGPLGGTVQALNRIHKDLNARLAAGRLSDAQYANKAREVLNVLANFDGLIAEASPRA